MGKPMLNKAKTAISTYQLLMQFETDDGKVGKIQGDQQTARECYVNSLKNNDVQKDSNNDVQKDSKKRKYEEGQPSTGLGVYITDNPKQYERPQPAEDDEEVAIGQERGRTVRVGKTMDPQTRQDIIQVLTEYQDVFAYEATEMPGLDPKIMCHELNIKEGFRPIKQKLRHQGPERNAEAAAEVKKLLEVGFIEECQYSEWLANVVLVKKPSGAWRMACPSQLHGRECWLSSNSHGREGQGSYGIHHSSGCLLL
ncbi:hypothetical protein BVRB_7g162600 [Beta vulgaris subsp. vulgaris]|nr:hypothetical protein BVRB_7g162600 [Beta vulgaris subsp. vulgaris]